jgi:hypothetical protein
MGFGAPVKSVALALFVVLAAHVSGCGQTTRSNEGQPADPPDGDTGARGGSSSAAPDATVGGSSAGSGGASGVGPGAADASGGAPPDDAVSGTRLCEDVRECSGLDCRSWAGAGVALCVRSCDTLEQCGDGELCLTAAALEPACVQRCEWPSDCLSGFDCFDWYQTGEYACVPTLWVRAL